MPQIAQQAQRGATELKPELLSHLRNWNLDPNARGGVSDAQVLDVKKALAPHVNGLAPEKMSIAVVPIGGGHVVRVNDRAKPEKPVKEFSLDTNGTTLTPASAGQSLNASITEFLAIGKPIRLEDPLRKPLEISSAEATSRFSSPGNNPLSPAQMEQYLSILGGALGFDSGTKTTAKITDNRGGLGFEISANGKLIAQGRIHQVSNETLSFTDFRTLKSTSTPESIQAPLPISPAMQSKDRMEQALSAYIAKYPADFELLGRKDLPNPLPEAVEQKHLASIRALLGAPKDAKITTARYPHGTFIAAVKNHIEIASAKLSPGTTNVSVTHTAYTNELRIEQWSPTPEQRDGIRHAVPEGARFAIGNPSSEKSAAAVGELLRKNPAYVRAFRELNDTAKSAFGKQIGETLGLPADSIPNVDIYASRGTVSISVTSGKNQFQAEFKISESGEYQIKTLEDRRQKSIDDAVTAATAKKFVADRSLDDIVSDTLKTARELLPALSARSKDRDTPALPAEQRKAIDDALRSALDVPETSEIDIQVDHSGGGRFTIQARSGATLAATVSYAFGSDQIFDLHHQKHFNYERPADDRMISEERRQSLLKALR